MIKSITITNHLNDSIKLELARPYLSGFAIKSIGGLGPAKATINTTEVATYDVGIFNSSRLTKRNITISMEFLQTSKETIEDLRQKSYKYFPVKRKIQLTVETDNHTVVAEGYVETNEPSIFSKNEGCDISIICPDPFFYSVSNATTVFSGIEPAFEFSFENNSTTEPLLELGSIRNKQEQVVVYEGDADIGLSMHIHAVGVAKNLKIANLRTGEIMGISTEKFAKYAPPFSYTEYPGYVAYRYGDEYGMLAKGPSTFMATVYDVNGYSKLYLTVSRVNGTGIKFGQYAFYDDDENCLEYELITSAALSYSYNEALIDIPEGATKFVVTSEDSKPIVTVHPDSSCPGIIDGDTITIHTHKGRKSVSLIRNGETHNILNHLEKGYQWFTLVKGDNLFAYTAESGAENLQFSIVNRIAYNGV